MTDQQILSGAGPTPVAITLDVAQRLLPKLAFAAFDGTGAAGDFLPVVKFVGPGGLVAGQAVGDVVAAGASVDQTWFRGVEKQGGAVSTTARETLTAASLVTVTPANSGPLTWAKINGSDLLDLTNPAQPTFVTAGVYSVSVTAQLFTLMTVGGVYRLQLAMSGSDFSDVVQSSPPAVAAVREPFVACTLTHFFHANQAVVATVFNFDAINLDFGLYKAAVQRIS